MMFAEYDRCQYLRSPLVEVICQLRFPTILSINANEPTEFQEAIRRDFPQYRVVSEQRPPRMVPGNPPRMEAPPVIKNYNFVSADGKWKLNLTQDFIALSTLSYTHWEDFATRLDKPLAQFIQLYQPAFFQRLGLRYTNAISRQRLGLADLLWDDLIRPHFIGVLGEPDVDETKVNKCAVDLEMTLPDCRLKVHAGPGLIGGGKTDPEPKFILDGDCSVTGDLTADQIPAHLDAMHKRAFRLFRGAITRELHEALGPVEQG